MPQRHMPEPDYERPLLAIAPEVRERILDRLGVLYGARRAAHCYPEIERLLQVYAAHRPVQGGEAPGPFRPSERFSERDVLLITYGDLLTNGHERPLESLSRFLDEHLQGVINAVHVLPFFPYSSDRGFAIIDYEEVDPRLGTWEDIERLADRYRLMFDGVFNHVSSKSRWFQRFLNDRPGYSDWFVSFDRPDALSGSDLRQILRPRASQLLTPFRTLRGVRHVWTTFSPDQIDLNFKNENVLYRVVETLLYYVRRGANMVRLDAVPYVWRAPGTRCANLEQTHALVQLLRACLDAAAPEVALITETNVPHADNVGYFGNGCDEAQLVYNFALPPLVLHAFLTGSCRFLRRWAGALEYPSDTANYLNFLSSHDGVGLLGARDVLPPEEINLLVQRCREHGGLVSNRRAEDGEEQPYELNITWWSALNRDGAGEPRSLQVGRFLASRAVALALRGVPGVYLPSLFGARNDSAAVRSGGEARSINRRTISWPLLQSWLGDPSSRQHTVLHGFRRLLAARTGHPAFHPNAAQRVLDLGDSVFALLRTPGGEAGPVLALTNVTPREQFLPALEEHLGGHRGPWADLLGGPAPVVTCSGRLEVTLPPYGVRWLTPQAPA